MTNEIKEKLDAEISSELEKLADMEMGSESYKTTVECISKLIDKQNDIDKIELERIKQISSERNDTDKIELERIKQISSEQKESNENIRKKELDEFNKKDQFIKNIISIGSILIPVFVTVWGTYKTLKFEETGTVTTIMGRGFINKLIPKK